MSPTAPLDVRPVRDRVSQYLVLSGLAALLLFDLPARFAGPTSPAWLAGVVLTGLTVGIPAGIAAFRHRAARRPDGSRP
ncbi:MAG TPA: hypothetical protein VIM08_03855 [Arthrobacter sp.]